MKFWKTRKNVDISRPKILKPGKKLEINLEKMRIGNSEMSEQKN